MPTARTNSLQVLGLLWARPLLGHAGHLLDGSALASPRTGLAVSVERRPAPQARVLPQHLSGRLCPHP